MESSTKSGLVAQQRHRFMKGLRRTASVETSGQSLPAELKGRRWFLSDYCLRSSSIRDYLEVEGLLSTDARQHYETKVAARS